MHLKFQNRSGKGVVQWMCRLLSSHKSGGDARQHQMPCLTPQSRTYCRCLQRRRGHMRTRHGHPSRRKWAGKRHLRAQAKSATRLIHRMLRRQLNSHKHHHQMPRVAPHMWCSRFLHQRAHSQLTRSDQTEEGAFLMLQWIPPRNPAPGGHQMFLLIGPCKYRQKPSFDAIHIRCVHRELCLTRSREGA